jgi:hypothetical protein
MVQPKYNPEEALQRVKLMMSYDSKKTLTENKLIIFEQKESCTNPISYEELLSHVEKVENAIDDTDNWTATKDMLDSSEEAKEIYDAIKSIAGKNVYDEESEKCLPAVSLFRTKYKEINSQDWVGGNRTLDEDLNSLLKLNLSSESNRYVRLAIKILNTAAATPVKQPKDNGGNRSDNTPLKKGGVKSGSSYKPCSGTYTYGCKSEVISKVQACVGGLTPDGKFGPKTKKVLAAKGITSFTDADITKICQTTVQKPKDEFTTQVDADSVDDILNN